jgi:hypothetical protein
VSHHIVPAGPHESGLHGDVQFGRAQIRPEKSRSEIK